MPSRSLCKPGKCPKGQVCRRKTKKCSPKKSPKKNLSVSIFLNEAPERGRDVPLSPEVKEKSVESIKHGQVLF